ncbi:hypothetical protein GH5_05355 [Leishmania sp. Ghana 2012 LV757]|uniref:hypothetical protein n=1 Tax=Leishmania sp. Ghana 2012 LV757 TaxID=2803181 RepID=UPI001B3D5768|nr:hypothetical protein GH5_05355 [Leishmania sp. Ghana 2012 LV757]
MALVLALIYLIRLAIAVCAVGRCSPLSWSSRKTTSRWCRSFSPTFFRTCFVRVFLLRIVPPRLRICSSRKAFGSPWRSPPPPARCVEAPLHPSL